ncbi:MAG: VIT domain-containing protein [Polyangiales bacterium]
MTPNGLATTDGRSIPLRGVEVEGEVLGAHARVRVRQRYRNEGAAPVEAVYTFPLPADATVSAFAMTCAGRTAEAVVKEREAAFRAYDDAVVAGHGAALLDQERPNVFTASVGNLLPDEETLIEVEYLQRVQADEGALRWMIPTLVAPRYVPGSPAGDRTAHGEHPPTDRVPDADRITPPRVAEVPYGLRLDLTFDLGREVRVESPSHPIATEREGGRVRVRFHQGEVALDRDVVLTARGVDEGAAPTASIVAHREKGKDGYLALGFVPDLWSLGAEAARRTAVTFLIDVSGSMEGDSIREARAALKLCLRHLRAGDSFNVIAFSSGHRAFAKTPREFSQQALDAADLWVNGLRADGGTELLAPLVEAVRGAPDGVVVLLTDGQVGNEAEILRATLQARGAGGARVCSFGIGTNVSDALLRDLARETGGAVEFIHPGERIDEKVVAQFSRAVAPRIRDVKVRFEGVDVGEAAPARAPDVVDGTPWSIFARYAAGASGHAELTGTYDGRPFTLRLPLDLPDEVSRPAVAKLWAAERIRDLDDVRVEGRRADAMKQRIVELSVEHGVASKYTSFVVVERRTGERRASGMPETAVVPVGLPAGWAMFDQPEGGRARGPMKKKAARPKPGAVGGVSYGAMPAPAPMGGKGVGSKVAPSRAAPPEGSLLDDILGEAGVAPDADGYDTVKKGVAHLVAEMRGPSGASHPALSRARAAKAAPPPAMDFMEMEQERASPSPARGEGGDDLGSLFARQLASGLWDDASLGPASDARAQRATLAVLRRLLTEGVDTSHPLHGAPLRKALEALAGATLDASVAEPLLALAWLLATGARTRAAVTAAITRAGLPSLSARLADPAALRAWALALP